MPENTPLIKAVLVGDTKQVLLLANSGTVNIKGCLGKTALQSAVLLKDTPNIIIDTLLKHGSDVNTLDDGGHTPLSDAGKGARTINDVYALRACQLIERGALWPKTDLGDLAWENLTAEVQQLFTEKLTAYQTQQALLQAEEKTKAFGMLSGFAGYIHQNQIAQSTTFASSGLHRRTVGQGDGIELKSFNN